MKHLILLAVSLCMVCCAAPNSRLPRANHAILNYDLGLDGQLASLSEQVAVQLARRAHRNIGIKGFYNLKGKTGRLEKYLEIEFVNRLTRTGMFYVYTPDDLSDLDSEKNITAVSNSSRYGNQTTNNVNRVDAYLIGSTVELPESVKVSVKLVAKTNGLVYGTASVLVHKDEAVDSLIDQFGSASAGDRAYIASNRTGRVIKAGDNQYVELIPQEYTLYVKQVNFEYSLFSNNRAYAEIFLNDEYRVMKIDDMIALTYDKERYVLSLRNIVDRTATFTFAHLATGFTPATDNFSPLNRDAFNKKDVKEDTSPVNETDLTDDQNSDEGKDKGWNGRPAPPEPRTVKAAPPAREKDKKLSSEDSPAQDSENKELNNRESKPDLISS